VWQRCEVGGAKVCAAIANNIVASITWWEWSETKQHQYITNARRLELQHCVNSGGHHFPRTQFEEELVNLKEKLFRMKLSNFFFTFWLFHGLFLLQLKRHVCQVVGFRHTTLF